MPPLPEGVRPYARWKGTLRPGPFYGVIAGAEIRRTLRDTWGQLAVAIVFFFTFTALADLFNDFDRNEVHPLDHYVDFLNNLRWGALAIAAVMAGPALLEDYRKGALELYFSRAVTRTDYLIGKVLAVFGFTAAATMVPTAVYYGTTYAFFKQHPPHWFPDALLQGLGYCLITAALVSGLGLALSCLARSSRAATILLFGGVVLADVVVAGVLAGITQDPKFEVLSPFAALQQQTEWMFNIDSGADFPIEWGVGILIGLLVGSWLIVALKHPRVRGEERAGP